MAKITGLKITNFKGVGQPGIEIDFRPITLLFGSNSAGKSTILQALQYAAEIFLKRNIDARKIGDEASETDIGGYANFVHRQELHRDVVIGVKIGLHEGEPLPSFGYKATENLDEPASLYDPVKELLVNLTVRWDRDRQIPFIHFYEVIADGQMLAKSIHHAGRKSLEIVLETSHPMFTKSAEHSSLEMWQHPEAKDDPGYAHDPEKSIMVNLKLLAGSVGAIKSNPTMIQQPGFLEAVTKNPDLMRLCSLSSFWVPVRDDALPDLDNSLPLALDDGGIIDDEAYAEGNFGELARYLREALSQLILGPAILARNALSGPRFLGQFREVPDRGHARGRAEGDGIWSNGIAAWNLLSRSDRAPLVEKVSNWLSERDKLDTGYLLRVKEYKEIDLDNTLVALLMQGRNSEDLSNIDRLLREARSQLGSLPTKVRVLFHPLAVGESADHGEDLFESVELTPKDLGVGISQIVPVVVAALDGPGTLVAVEQPELHLHPRMQARIGDLFIQGMKAGNWFLLETHSEHLIFRLQRRIRELVEAGNAAANAELTLSPDDLGIWHVSINEGNAEARQITLDKHGNFSEPWPDDFFDIGFKERFSC